MPVFLGFSAVKKKYKESRYLPEFFYWFVDAMFIQKHTSFGGSPY
jgi:hypothetical protein